ncbi:MAG: DUF1579 domain-containing protein [Pseudomonadota bacterium]
MLLSLPTHLQIETMPLPPDISAPSDFDFIIGDWLVKHERLNSRLANCDEWTSFEGQSSTVRILGGFGNLEDNLLHFPGDSFRAAAMRSYCARTRTWSIWWLDGRNPTQLDTPVVGSFENQTGLFFADDVLDGQAIRVRFTWTAIAGENPRWEQAFSSDGGAKWETNWKMEFFPAVNPTST